MLRSLNTGNQVVYIDVNKVTGIFGDLIVMDNGSQIHITKSPKVIADEINKIIFEAKKKIIEEMKANITNISISE